MGESGAHSSNSPPRDEARGKSMIERMKKKILIRHLTSFYQNLKEIKSLWENKNCYVFQIEKSRDLSSPPQFSVGSCGIKAEAKRERQLGCGKSLRKWFPVFN